MKTSALIIAAVITGTTFATTSAMAQQGGIGGKLNWKSSATISGKVDAAKNASAHLGNLKMNNSRVNGNVNGNVKSIVNGDVIVKNGGKLEHSSVYLNDSQISGNLKANLQATSGSIKVGKNAKLYVSALDMQGSKVNGDLSITSKSKTGSITLKDDAYANIASLRMKDSTLNGGMIVLDADTGNVTVDKGGKLYLSAMDMQGATITGQTNFKSNTDIGGDVHVKKDGMLNVASLILNGGTYGGVDHEVNVTMSHGITAESGAEVEIGAVELYN